MSPTESYSRVNPHRTSLAARTPFPPAFTASLRFASKFLSFAVPSQANNHPNRHPRSEPHSECRVGVVVARLTCIAMRRSLVRLGYVAYFSFLFSQALLWLSPIAYSLVRRISLALLSEHFLLTHTYCHTRFLTTARFQFVDSHHLWWIRTPFVESVIHSFITIRGHPTQPEFCRPSI
jgi:hypothetical protein